VEDPASPSRSANNPKDTMIGQTFSHYNIIEKLGEGGMGIVYKATDTKLNRMVALKFLPEHISASEADTARFIQEAQSAAGLSHPNICTIHGIEEAQGKHFIVMEFVDGETLQQKKSGLSTKQALDIGIQVAEGLSAAHEKGIVHRDIKPENIMIRKDGRVQIMDFGLAKLRGASRLTKEGSTVGTAGYMSPEQVQGQETDHRSDIFSLGVLLYEMLSGQPPFKGMHETAIAYEIVNVDSPPMSAIKTEIPPELDAIVLDCLEKDPAERTQAASQVALELKRYKRESSRQRASRITAATPVASPPSSPSGGIIIGPTEGIVAQIKIRQNLIVPALIAVAGVLAGFGISLLLGGNPPLPSPIRSSLESPEGLQFSTEFGGHSIISPDGTMLAFVGVDTVGKSMLCVRPLASKGATKLSGTDGAAYPFWSPDNRSLGFFAGGKLKRVDVSGNPPLVIADAASGRGGSWSKKGIIVFSPEIEQQNLFQVSASGGIATPVTNHDSTKAPRFPFFLPDGKRFLYVRIRLGAGGSPLRDDFEVHMGSLAGDSARLPLQGVSNVMYSSGYLLYVRQETLIAQAFDPGNLELTGTPVPIDNNVNFWPARAKGDFSVSATGVLVYGTKFASDAKSELVWIDRDGRMTQIVQANPSYMASLSPDGKRIAFDELDTEQNNLDIWIYDVTRGIKTRFTFDFDFDMVPLWTPDGSSVLFSSTRGRNYKIFSKRSDGTKNEEVVIQKENNSEYATDISPDGRFVLVTEQSPTWNLAYADLKGDSSVQSIISTKFNEGFGAFSPDGRWVAFQSDESGRDEVYVIPFLREGGKHQISTSGGTSVLWSKSGEIFFTSANRLMVVKADVSGASPRFGPPSPLFAVGSESGLRTLDVSTDGRRFLVKKSANIGIRNSLSVVVNWQGLLEQK
jgi:serine/threonine protein kinase